MPRRWLGLFLLLALLLSGCSVKSLLPGKKEPDQTTPKVETPPLPPEPPKALDPFYAEDLLVIGLPTNDCLNLRDAPSKQALVLACVPGGSKLVAMADGSSLPAGVDRRSPVLATGEEELWAHVRTEAGLAGWSAVGAGMIRLERSALANLAKGEIDQARFALGAATGEIDPCANADPTKGCIFDTTLANQVEAWIIRCGKVGPEEMLKDPRYKPEQDGRWVQGLVNLCSGLTKAVDSLGAPADSPAWKQRLKELRAALPS